MSGYIGTQPVPQATQTRDSFTATSNQTSFPTSGYTPNFLDVFLNGVKLAAADYTATNNSDVVLAVGAATGDILEVVAYTAFDTANVTGAVDFTVTGDITVNGTVDGVDIAARDAVLTSTTTTAGAALPKAGGALTGEVTTTNAFKAHSSSSGDYVRMYGGTGTGKWDIYGNGANLRIGDNESAGIVTIDTALNVGGTVTADKLNVTHAGGGDFIGVFQNTTSATPYGVHIKDAASGANGYPLLQVTNSAGSSPYFLVHSGTGNVGIGESSPLGKLHIKGSDTGATASAQGNSLVLEDLENGLSILSSTAGAGYINFGDSGDNNIGMIVYDHSANALKTHVNGTERMRISSDGSVLVGKTAPNQDVAGIELSANDYILVTSTGTSAYLNRISSDGVIQEFRKDGTTVGSIFSGHGGSQVGIGTNTTGITFNPSTRSMMPANPSSTNPQLDATLDIGFSSVRWKDLYLSGGVYLGGTGAANKLDDYEEGTWTPQYDANTVTWNYGTQYGSYVKIGQLVHIQFYLQATVASGTTSFAAKIINLPFNAANLSPYHQSGMSVWFSGSVDVQPLVDNAVSKISLWKKGTVSTATAAEVNNIYLVGGGTYFSA